METVLAVLGSAGLFAFIEFLIKRRDEKKGLLYWIKKELIQLKEDRELDRAEDARRRILDATDELRNGLTLHSLEWYNQQSSDIDTYERYCNSHEQYKNNKADLAIQFFKQNYAKRMENNDFL